MMDTVRFFKTENELLDQYGENSNLASWGGPGFYYLSPDYHWNGPFQMRASAEKALKFETDAKQTTFHELIEKTMESEEEDRIWVQQRLFD